MNRYEDVGSNPTTLTDPFGLEPSHAVTRPTSQPATPAPHKPNGWVIPGGFDLVLVMDTEENFKVNRHFWGIYQGANPDSDVRYVNTAALATNAIIRRSKEVAQKRGVKAETTVPITVLFIAHGGGANHEGIVYANEAKELLLPLPPQAFIRPDKDVVDDLQKMDIFKARGLILSMTFTSCAVAGDKDGESLLEIVRKELGIQTITAPKRNGEVFPSGGAVEMYLLRQVLDPNITKDNIGDYIYTTPDDAKKGK